MNLYDIINNFMASAANALWGTPLVVLLLGGGIYFSIISKLTPFRYLFHALDILRGKYDSEDDPGQITHFQALSSALSSTVGMGNIAGVAVAIHTGGPGSIFWMWCTAVLGMSTKFFSCTLSIMYRGVDDKGEVQGGVMYYIEQGLGKNYKPLAIMFSLSGMIGCTIFFQANQLSQIVREYLYNSTGIFQNNIFFGDLVTGFIVATIVSVVIFGGIKRIALVASRMVPVMVGIYLIAAIIVISKNFQLVPGIFSLIVTDAFSGNAVAGGAIGSMISIGVRRGLFSNEAGSGTETMAHGAAKTKEPVREGLVAMLGPLIDTIIVCSITAVVILLSGVYTQDLNGVSMTVAAFENQLGLFGKILIMIAVVTFSLSTMFGYSYYGRKCTSYLFGTKWKQAYNLFYVAMIIVASTISIDIAINFMDSAFALMVIPTMIATILLAPNVINESRKYFKKI
ncbi:alanine:cation symporter family protein [Candidatus Marinimicrobia bacterium]|nr:alanine:cation symporter family protein [Candidatus Neomarinimicrobiota bacterium]